jgi:hypothetical protein
MKKLAIFVEGQTERIFVEKMLIEVAGRNNIVLREEKTFRKIRGRRTFQIIKNEANNPQKKYYVLIRDSSSDSTVKSDIIDNCERLTNSGYSKIIGLRDVYPYYDIKKLRKNLAYGLPTKYAPISIHLSVMEIEAWFIAETSHFSKIHPGLTLENIKKNLSYDLINENIEEIPHPAYALNRIYKIGNRSYNKSKRTVKRTVNAIDYANLYLDVRTRIKSLDEFISELDSFFI